MTANELIRRLECLERGNSRWKLATMALLLACVVMLLAGFDYPRPNLVKARSVEAQTFVLRDADGQTLYLLGIQCDVSAQVKAEFDIRSLNERLAALSKAAGPANS